MYTMTAYNTQWLIYVHIDRMKTEHVLPVGRRDPIVQANNCSHERLRPRQGLRARHDVGYTPGVVKGKVWPAGDQPWRDTGSGRHTASGPGDGTRWVASTKNFCRLITGLQVVLDRDEYHLDNDIEFVEKLMFSL